VRTLAGIPRLTLPENQPTLDEFVTAAIASP
jgi:hypothetical protein